MGGQQAVIAIGVGCRSGCSGAEIAGLVRASLAALPAGVDHRRASSPCGLFSIDAKRGEPGLHAAADALGLPLTFLDLAALERVAEGAQTRSARVEARFGLPSVAETAALAGAGAGAVLLVPRRASPAATCAIAACAVAGPLASDQPS